MEEFELMEFGDCPLDGYYGPIIPKGKKRKKKRARVKRKKKGRR